MLNEKAFSPEQLFTTLMLFEKAFSPPSLHLSAASEVSGRNASQVTSRWYGDGKYQRRKHNRYIRRSLTRDAWSKQMGTSKLHVRELLVRIALARDGLTTLVQNLQLRHKSKDENQ